jgi:hypothetical protein
VHADHALGVRGRFGDGADREGRRVRRQERVGAAQAAEGAKSAARNAESSSTTFDLRSSGSSRLSTPLISVMSTSAPATNG